MQHLIEKVQAAVDMVRARWPIRPRAGIILGTGLGNLASCIESDAILSYEDIPYFPRSTAIGHRGQLACGTVSGLPVVTMEGRFHVYEGYPQWQITLPLRVMKGLGIDLLIVSNASGGLNPRYRSSDVVVIEDHVNLMSGNPLIGINQDALGPRFPDMSRPYDLSLIEQVLEIARRENFVVHRGVYVALSGPNYETRAEYRFLRNAGDIVGMSTVPEVIVAVHAGIRVLALSTVTNVCNPDFLAPTSGEAVVAAAASAEWKVRKIVLDVLANEVRNKSPAPSPKLCSQVQ